MRRFGIEIEALGMSRTEVVELLNANGIRCRDAGYTHRVETGWKVVSDASVSNGFEVVSPPLSGEEGLAEVLKIVSLLNDAGCDVNKSCGIHVHVDAHDLTAQHIANVYNRYRRHEADIDRLMPNSRRADNNRYCKSLTRLCELTARHDAASTCRERADRYYKVNLCSFVKYGTIEFRHHSGSLNTAKIKNWIRFLLQFVEASRPETESAVAPTVPTFRGKTRTIVEAIQERPCTVHELARMVDQSVVTVRSRIHAIRRRGLQIVNRAGRYVIANTPDAERLERVQSNQPDSLWKQIDQSIVRYYRRRAQLLAA